MDDSDSTDGTHEFFKMPESAATGNILPCESEILQLMGFGESVISGKTLARAIVKKLGLKADL